MTGAAAPLLLVSRGGADSDLLYACRVALEEAVYLGGDGEEVLVVPRLELERARAEGRVRRVIDRAEVGWGEHPDRFAAWTVTIARLLRERGLRRVRVSPRLPAVYYSALAAEGFELGIDRDLFVAERRRKSVEEAAWIRAAQAAAEAACVAVIRRLAAADAGAADGWLRLDGRPLTSERLMAVAQAALNERGHAAVEMIVAGAPGCAQPHFRGAGPIAARGPVIIDIFPRGQSSGYHGDLTRTVVPGPIQERFRRMHEACVAALQAAISATRAGGDGRVTHQAACRALVERGYGTTTAGFEGQQAGPVMNHSTGHGVGLDVHEAPGLRDLHSPLLAGDVVTIEPGLYQAGVGGVRVEDTGMVTEAGFENFTSLPYSLDPEAYV